MSEVGLLPSWIHLYAHVATNFGTCSSLRKIVDFLVDDKWLGSLLKTIQSIMATKLGTQISIHKIKNIFWKLYRIKQKKDHLWFDMLFPGQTKSCDQDIWKSNLWW
jgi:hypothetical protein